MASIRGHHRRCSMAAALLIRSEPLPCKKYQSHRKYNRTGLQPLWVVDSGWKPSWLIVRRKFSILQFPFDHHMQSYSSGGLTTSRQINPYCNDDDDDDDAIVQKLCKEGRLSEALHLVEHMVQRISTENTLKRTFICLLKACAMRKAFTEGKQVHALMVQSKCDSNTFLANNLIEMYSKCGSLPYARAVFNAMPHRNVFSWTTIISAYVKCGCLEDARGLFDNMNERNVVSWNVMIAGYAQHGHGKEALSLYEQMKQEGMQADKVTFICLLKACTKIRALEEGRLIHSHILESGLGLDVIVQSTLIDMYAKCGCLEDACKLFNSMTERDVVSCSAMIAGYARNGFCKEALVLYEQMKQEGLQADKTTFISVLKACANSGVLEKGKQIHSFIIENGFDLDVIVQNTLVDMYVKCGCLEDARELFNNMNGRTVVSWTTMIAGYAKNGLGEEALALYEEMKQQGVQPNKVTFVCLLKACANIRALEQGKQIHSLILEKGFDADMIVQNSLVDMYSKCGCVLDAREVFNNMSDRDVISWNAMIAGYVEHGLGREALSVYDQMKQEGVKADKVTFVCVLKACSKIGALEQGRLIHFLIQETGFDSDVILQSTLVDMYAKCRRLEDAHKLFNSMTRRDLVAWNVMITGYVQNGLGDKALALYEQMKQEGLNADKQIFVSLLKACSNIGGLVQGKQIHSFIQEKGFDQDMIVQSTLVDMYAKCGCLEEAQEVFFNMSERDVVSWNAMIGGYARNGLGKKALALYEQMKQEGIRPEDGTYTSILSACRHSGLVEEGCHVFDFMHINGITPTAEHYSCVVDLLVHAGLTTEAEYFILKMPVRPDSVVWMSLLGAARNGGNTEVGQSAFHYTVNLEPQNVAPYLLLRDMYATAHQIDKVAKITKEMLEIV